MSLDRVNAAWKRLADEDPLWAVCVRPETKGNRWGAAEFYATGTREVETSLARAAELGLCTERGRALDFGCGAGRLTYALADAYEEVVGLDVTERMLELARESNPHGDRCSFVRNPAADLSMFGDATFDLVYTSLVLQHMPVAYSTAFLAEFVRVLKPGGALVVHIPAKTRFSVKGLLFRWAPRPVLELGQRLVFRYPAQMEMHCIGTERVREILGRAGAEVLAADDTDIEGSQWFDVRYFGRKTGALSQRSMIQRPESAR